MYSDAAHAVCTWRLQRQLKSAAPDVVRRDASERSVVRPSDRLNSQYARVSGGRDCVGGRARDIGVGRVDPVEGARWRDAVNDARQTTPLSQRAAELPHRSVT